MSSLLIAAPVLAALLAGVALRLLWEHRTTATAWAERRWTARYHRPIIHAYHRPAHRRDTPRPREAAA